MTSDQAQKRHDDAVIYMTNVSANDGIEYEWVWDYGKYIWEHHSKVFSIIDDKAEAIIKYLGGGTGLFALGVLSRIDAANSYLALWSLPAVSAALVSILLAVIAKKPRSVPNPPSSKDAKETYADKSKDETHAKGVFVGQWHLASEDMYIECQRKARWLDWSLVMYYASILLLVLPIIVAIKCPPSAH